MFLQTIFSRRDISQGGKLKCLLTAGDWRGLKMILEAGRSGETGDIKLTLKNDKKMTINSDIVSRCQNLMLQPGI